MASDLKTLKDFLDTINISAFANYHDVDHLMTPSCDDDENQGFPFVGITRNIAAVFDGNWPFGWLSPVPCLFSASQIELGRFV